MKKLLNTLFVTTQGAYLCHEGEFVLVRAEGEERLRVPIHHLEGIVCFGDCAVSSALLGLCSERGVMISFLAEHGRFRARVGWQVHGNVLLRRRQFHVVDIPTARLEIARSIVLGKLANARTVLRRAVRDHGEKVNADALEQAALRLSTAINSAREERDIERLRGLEGEAGRIYFEALDHAIVTQKDAFFLHGRSRRPPLDNMNALLSFLYTLLVHDAEGALESVGLDPQVGFLHAERPGRPSLALDLIEELRPFLADRLALSLVNLRQVGANGFEITPSGGVSMDDETRKTVITAYQQRKREEIRHPFLEESIPVGMLAHVQALLLARHLRGDMDAYPPFIWK